MPAVTPAGAQMLAPRNLSAALFALGSTAILSFVDNFVAEMSRSHGLWQFQVVRAMMAVPLLILGGVILRQRLRPVNLPRLAARSLAVSVGLLIYFAALGTLSVAQAGAGVFSAPIWVLILSAVLFRNPVSVLQAGAILTGFGGALMLLQPDFANFTLLSLFPLGAGLFYGLGMLLTRFWCAGESPIALTIGIFLAMAGLSLILLVWFTFGEDADSTEFVARGWEAITGYFLWLTLIQAVGAVVAVTLIAQAYRIGSPAYVAVFEYSFLIFAGLWSYLLWGQGTNALAWGGILVIIASGVVMSLLQRRQGSGS